MMRLVISDGQVFSCLVSASAWDQTVQSGPATVSQISDDDSLAATESTSLLREMQPEHQLEELCCVAQQ